MRTLVPIATLYNFDKHIFDDIYCSPFLKEDFIDYFLLEYGSLTPIYTEPKYLQRHFRVVARSLKWTIDKLADLSYYKYNPLENMNLLKDEKTVHHENKITDYEKGTIKVDNTENMDAWRTEDEKGTQDESKNVDTNINENIDLKHDETGTIDKTHNETGARDLTHNETGTNNIVHNETGARDLTHNETGTKNMTGTETGNKDMTGNLKGKTDVTTTANETSAKSWNENGTDTHTKNTTLDETTHTTGTENTNSTKEFLVAPYNENVGTIVKDPITGEITTKGPYKPSELTIVGEVKTTTTDGTLKDVGTENYNGNYSKEGDENETTTNNGKSITNNSNDTTENIQTQTNKTENSNTTDNYTENEKTTNNYNQNTETTKNYTENEKTSDNYTENTDTTKKYTEHTTDITEKTEKTIDNINITDTLTRHDTEGVTRNTTTQFDNDKDTMQNNYIDTFKQYYHGNMGTRSSQELALKELNYALRFNLLKEICRLYAEKTLIMIW